jgi:hypothetical protein
MDKRSRLGCRPEKQIIIGICVVYGRFVCPVDEAEAGRNRRIEYSIPFVGRVDRDEPGDCGVVDSQAVVRVRKRSRDAGNLERPGPGRVLSTGIVAGRAAGRVRIWGRHVRHDCDRGDAADAGPVELKLVTAGGTRVRPESERNCRNTRDENSYFHGVLPS